MNLTQNKDQLLALMRRPKTQKKPSNFALWWAWAFYNVVALFLDTITAYTVYTLTNFLYAALVFFSGFMPLLMHEFLFIRAYASKVQRGIAIFGAGMSVLAIIGIGLLAGVLNVIGINAMANALYIEVAVISLIVFVAAGHGLLAAAYFYLDEGIRANHNQAEAIAYHDQQLANINLALDLAEKVKQAAQKEDEFISRFGDRELLNEAMNQITGTPLSAAAKPASIKNIIRPVTQTQDPEVELMPVPLVGFSGNGNGHKSQ